MDTYSGLRTALARRGVGLVRRAEPVDRCGDRSGGLRGIDPAYVEAVLGLPNAACRQRLRQRLRGRSVVDVDGAILGSDVVARVDRHDAQCVRAVAEP